MNDEPNIIDLDSLVPQAVTVKFGGEEIEIPPPKTADILRLGFLGQKMESAGDLDAAALEGLVADLTAQVHKCIPALDGKPLNTAQLLKLIEIISKAGMPADAKELQAKGITVDTSKKAA